MDNETDDIMRSTLIEWKLGEAARKLNCTPVEAFRNTSGARDLSEPDATPFGSPETGKPNRGGSDDRK